MGCHPKGARDRLTLPPRSSCRNAHELPREVTSPTMLEVYHIIVAIASIFHTFPHHRSYPRLDGIEHGYGQVVVGQGALRGSAVSGVSLGCP